MKVIKRSGCEVKFDEKKILHAIIKANESVEDIDKLKEE
ncbi:MAG: ATP cone domain-containing protein, partial [Candidatus Caccosoma sp.]|nr:ATP cone domain-containing protein [Candidatus Caccosoma sp.]